MIVATRRARSTPDPLGVFGADLVVPDRIPCPLGGTFTVPWRIIRRVAEWPCLPAGDHDPLTVPNDACGEQRMAPLAGVRPGHCIAYPGGEW